MFFQRSKNTNFLSLPLSVRGKLFVSPMPYGPYDPFNQLIRKYRRHRVSLAVVLVTQEEMERKSKRNLFELYRHEGIEIRHTPMKDMTAPSLPIIQNLMPDLVHRLNLGKNIAVHCNAGVGRTGVVAGCLVRELEGLDGGAAIQFITEHMMIQMTDEQKRFVRNWSAEA